MISTPKPSLQTDSLKDLVDQVEAREIEKEQKKAERLQRQQQKFKNKQRDVRERLVAPILLIISLIVSALLWAIRNLN